MADENPFVIVNVNDFTKALSGIGSVVPARSTVPILSNVMIAQKGGTLRLTATDLDMEIRFPMAPIDFGGEIETTVSAKRLTDIFRNLDEGAQAKLTYTENRQIVVTCGRGRFVLPTLAIDEFPLMEIAGESTELVFTAGGLKDILNRLAFAQSNDEIRYYLHGINMHRSEDGRLCLAATDGHSLAFEKFGESGFVEEDFPNIIFPRFAVAVLTKLLDNVDPEKEVSFDVLANKVHIEVDDWWLTTKLIEGEFPQYRRVIPENNQQIATINRAELQKIAKRVQVFADGKDSAVKFDFTKDKLILDVRSKEAGTATEEMPCAYSSDDMIVALNGRYLLSQLAVHPAEELNFSMAGPDGPVRIEGFLTGQEENPEFLTVLMPMKV